MAYHRKFNKDKYEHEKIVRETYLLKKFFEFTVTFVNITFETKNKKSNEITINDLLSHIDHNLKEITPKDDIKEE